MSDQKQETIFKASDVRLLRERLVWALKKSPPHIREQIHQTILLFAKNVSAYCKHEDFVYVAAEDRNACLNCGTRSKVENPDSPDLKLLQ